MSEVGLIGKVGVSDAVKDGSLDPDEMLKGDAAGLELDCGR